MGFELHRQNPKLHLLKKEISPTNLLLYHCTKIAPYSVSRQKKKTIKYHLFFHGLRLLLGRKLPHLNTT